MGNTFPPSVFRFAVCLDPASGGVDVVFHEVSGLDAALETMAVPEGGENRFVHALPKSAKASRLTLKRGLAAADSGLVKWCQQVLEGWLAVPIQAKLIEVHLMGPTGEALRRWRFTGAYPVRWSVDSFSSTQQELALEMVELAYSTVERVP